MLLISLSDSKDYPYLFLCLVDLITSSSDQSRLTAERLSHAGAMHLGFKLVVSIDDPKIHALQLFLLLSFTHVYICCPRQ